LNTLQRTRHQDESNSHFRKEQQPHLPPGNNVHEKDCEADNKDENIVYDKTVTDDNDSNAKPTA
jgi:hypothetical protein